MGRDSKIEWTGATWNPITGCTIVSAGCANCYTMQLAGTRLAHTPSRQGLTRKTADGRPVWNGQVRFNEAMLFEPLRWRKPTTIFVCAHGDLFHEKVPAAWIDQVFAVMALAPHHQFQVLTKRPERMRGYMSNPRRPYLISRRCIDVVTRDPKAWGRLMGRPTWPVISEGDPEDPSDISLNLWPLPHVWLGTSIEDQDTADERIPLLLETPASVRFVSAEPLLGPVDLTSLNISGDSQMDALKPASYREIWDYCWSPEATGVPLAEAIEHYTEEGGVYPPTDDRPPGLDWVIVGGESGPGARPMHPDWARDLRDQCAAAGVAFFFKQWGEWTYPYDRDIEDPDWRRCDLVERGDPKGRWLNLAGGHGFHGERVVRATRVGKKIAGRLLDGVEHSAMPTERAP